MRIHFFGKLGDRIGRSVEIDLRAEVRTIADLRGQLAALWPEAADALAGPGLRACIDDEIVSEDHDIKDCDLVEFFPPLSGG